MNDHTHTILCVDDEENILNSLKRLLRKDGYRLLTATSGAEGLKILEENDIHLVITDQRMPGMSGTEFLSVVKEQYPDVIRIALTGFTEVDAITESINKGHVYKFMLKPWNDQSLKLEISQALEQYELVMANKALTDMILGQNEELSNINEDLETLVQERTKELEIHNQALELSHAILEDLPTPIVGVSAEGIIVLLNQTAQRLSFNAHSIEIGREFADYFSTDAQEKMAAVISTNTAQTITGYGPSSGAYDIDFTPLSGKLRGKGIILTLTQVKG